MKHNPDRMSDWEGRLYCQNERGQSINRVLKSPSAVAEEVKEGKGSFELFLVLHVL